MKLLLLWASLVLLQVIEISSTSEIITKPFSLIYFYAPDCRYCEGFNPDFEYLSALYNGNTDLQVVKVNGRKHKDMVRLFDVKSFPSLKLYDADQKQVVTYSQARDVEKIEQFIQEKTRATPDLLGVESLINEVSHVSDLNITDEQPLLLAFVSRLSLDWITYYYPGHFYQSIAREYPNITFAIVFADEIDSELMQKYHVSNIPSLVLVDKSGIQVHNTLSTNQMVNYKISEEDIRDIIERKDHEEGWFPDLDSLYQHVESLEYDGHRQRKEGMNVIESREENHDMDEEYQMLLAQIRL